MPSRLSRPFPLQSQEMHLPFPNRSALSTRVCRPVVLMHYIPASARAPVSGHKLSILDSEYINTESWSCNSGIVLNRESHYFPLLWP